jgi:hypothetical protein
LLSPAQNEHGGLAQSALPEHQISPPLLVCEATVRGYTHKLPSDCMESWYDGALLLWLLPVHHVIVGNPPTLV